MKQTKKKIKKRWAFDFCPSRPTGKEGVHDTSPTVRTYLALNFFKIRKLRISAFDFVFEFPNLCIVPRPSYSSTVTARHLLGYFFSVLIGERFKLIKIIDNCL